MKTYHPLITTASTQIRRTLLEQFSLLYRQKPDKGGGSIWEAAPPYNWTLCRLYISRNLNFTSSHPTKKHPRLPKPKFSRCRKSENPQSQALHKTQIRLKRSSKDIYISDRFDRLPWLALLTNPSLWIMWGSKFAPDAPSVLSLTYYEKCCMWKKDS